MEAKSKVAAENEGNEAILEGDPRWEVAQRAARGAALSRATQLKSILLFIVRQAILRPEETIHESDIACRVLGRHNDFSPLEDNIVRVQVARLRKKLHLYFSVEGKNEPVELAIALNSYKPVFSDRSEASPSTKVPLAVIASEGDLVSVDKGIAVSPICQSPDIIPGILQAFDRRRWLIAKLIIIVLTIICLALWIQNRAIHRSFYPWQYQPSVAKFWSEFLNARPDTDVILADSSFDMIQHLTKRSFSINDYVSRSYIGQIQALDISPDMRESLSQIAVKNLGNPGEFKLARRILALDPTGKTIHLYSAREYMPALFNQDNAIIMGSHVANPWDELFENSLDFIVETENTTVTETYVSNRAPAAGEEKIYAPTTTDGYCIVAYLPNPNHTGKVLLIEGTGGEATEAAENFLLSEDQLSNFQKILHQTKLPYFELLLKTSQVKATPFAAAIVAYRIYPNLH